MIEKYGAHKGMTDVYRRRDRHGTFYYARTLMGFDTLAGGTWRALNQHQSEMIQQAIEFDEREVARNNAAEV